MSEKKTLLQGTLILTAAGILSRFIGFYNRIFLSKTIGAENMGIYQLIFPVLMFVYCVTIQGIQTALTKMVSALRTRKENSGILFLLRFSLLLSLMLAFFFTGLLVIFAKEISVNLLHHSDCILYLQLSAIAIPFVSIKGILHGYGIGLKKVGLSASSQLVEQLARVGCIIILAKSIEKGWIHSPYLAIAGMLAGEIISSLYSIIYYFAIKKNYGTQYAIPIPKESLIGELFRLSVPLTANRIVISGLNSLQSIITPIVLTKYYGSQTVAMELFGILSGMAIPFLFFPTAITNSLSTLVLPTIASAKANHNHKQIKKTTYSCVIGCMAMGIGFMFLFLLFGNYAGILLFHEERAGQYIQQMAFLCPFFYVSSTLNAILNGLGKTKLTFYNNIIHSLVQLLFLILLTPRMGINGFIYTSMIGHALLFILSAHQIKDSMA